jgi:hypothetical protein
MNVPEAASRLKQKWNQFATTVNRPDHCIYCKGDMVHYNGFRSRTASVMVEGETHTEVVYLDDITCRRVKCGTAGCRKSWTLRPPGLVSGRHFQLDVVASASSTYLFDEDATRSSVAQTHQCSPRSVARWLAWLALLASPMDLQRHLVDVLDLPLMPRLQPVASAARKALSAAKRQMLTRAAQVLLLLEALAMALGYEPPGLRSVVEALGNNRAQVAPDKEPSIPDLAQRLLTWPVAGYPYERRFTPAR